MGPFVHTLVVLQEAGHTWGIGQEPAPSFGSSPVDNLAVVNDKKLNNTVMRDADAKIYENTEDLSQNKELPEEGFVHRAESDDTVLMFLVTSALGFAIDSDLNVSIV